MTGPANCGDRPLGGIERDDFGNVYRNDEFELLNGCWACYTCVEGQISTTITDQYRLKLVQYCHNPVIGWRRWLQSGRYRRGWRTLPLNRDELNLALEALMIMDERDIAGKLIAEIARYGYPK